jgi:redox-sensitive bicupin YhaK (pirin superfamily)
MDEILSYMRKGTMLHEDTSGARLPLTPTHFAAMNAGSGMWHEESASDDGELVEMLQIFVRPREDDLPPTAKPWISTDGEPNTWRLLAGPEQPMRRSRCATPCGFHDAHLERASLQTPFIAGLDGHLCVFQGEISSSGHRLIAGDSLIILGGETVEISAPESADLISLSG